jgi:FkbM family methyltransferase
MIPMLRDKKDYFKSILRRFITVLTRRNAFYLGDYCSLTKLFTGHPFYVDTRDISLTPSILLTGCWEPHITFYYRKLVKKGMVVVDVGSHMGYYTVLAGDWVGHAGKVHSFEANPTIFETTFKNVFSNGLIDRVTVNNKAIYSHSEKLMFNTLSRATGGNSFVEFTDEYKKTFQEEVKRISVDSISLDEYFENESNFNVDIIKIDAEGTDPFVFRGMNKILSANPSIKIFCEFNAGLIKGCGNDPSVFLKEIEKTGLKLFKIEQNHKLSCASIEELISIGQADLLLSKVDL